VAKLAKLTTIPGNVQCLSRASVLDDVVLNRTRYIIKRRGVSHAIVLSFDDFAYMLRDDGERRRMVSVLRELRPQYSLGEVIEPEADQE
jgi:hypothetical protein